MTLLPYNLSPDALDRATAQEIARLSAKTTPAQPEPPEIGDYLAAANLQLDKVRPMINTLREMVELLQGHTLPADPAIGRRALDILRWTKQLLAHWSTPDIEVSGTTLAPDDDGGRLVQCWLYVTREQAEAARNNR